jgi:hypothetical protein
MNFDIINQFKYMKSHTKIIIGDSRRMFEIEDSSIDLVGL